MTKISIEDVKKLRDETGVSVMQCKKALEEADGDMEKAKVILRKISADIAAKKSDRELGSGTVQAYVHTTGKICGVVALACETDFVANNEEFKRLAYELAMHVAAMAPQFIKEEDVTEEDIKAAKEVFEEEIKDKPEDIKEQILEGKIKSYLKDKVFMMQTSIKETDKTIEDLIKEATQKFGERIEVADVYRFAF